MHHLKYPPTGLEIRQRPLWVAVLVLFLMGYGACSLVIDAWYLFFRLFR